MADYNIQINAQDNASASINRIQGGLGGLGATAGRVKGLLAGAFAVGGAAALGATVQNTIDNFDALAKSARAAGAASSEDAFRGFQVLKQAMNEAGIDAATFDRAMLQTTSRLKEGAEGNKAFVEIFEKLGPAVKGANGELKAGPELLQAMINALNEGTISTDEFAKVVGGRAGPLIQQQFASIAGSAEDLAGLLDDVEANSNIVSLEASQNAEVFNDTVGRLKEGLGQLLTDAVTPLLPHLVELSENILANMPQYIEAVKAGFEKVQPILNLLGTVLTDLVVPIMSKLFEVLGTIAEAITPLIEKSLPFLREGFEFVATAVQAVFDNMLPLIESALPAVTTGFDLLKSGLDFVFNSMKVVYDTAVPLMVTGFEKVRAIVESLVAWFQKVSDKLTQIRDKAAAIGGAVKDKFGDMKDGVVNTTGAMVEGAKKKFQEFGNWSIFQSYVPDMVNAIINEFHNMAMGAIDQSGLMTNGLQGEFMNMGNMMGSELGSIQNMFQSTFGNILSNAQGAFSGLSQVFGGMGSGIGGFFKNIFGGGGGGGLFGGLVSKVGGFFKNIFGGFFANGGYLPAGKIGIAGEAGPELISGPANVTPLTGMGMGGGAPVTININAIDTQTGTQFLLNNRDKIEGIIQRAYNKQGRQGIY